MGWLMIYHPFKNGWHPNYLWHLWRWLGVVYYSYTHITLWQPNIAAEKSPFFMGKLTISMACSMISYVKLPESPLSSTQKSEKTNMAMKQLQSNEISVGESTPVSFYKICQKSSETSWALPLSMITTWKATRQAENCSYPPVLKPGKRKIHKILLLRSFKWIRICVRDKTYNMCGRVCACDIHKRKHTHIYIYIY